MGTILRPRRWLTSGAPASRHLLEAAGFGVAAGAIVGVVGTGPWELAVLVGWDVGAAAFLLAVWSVILRFDAMQTARLATHEDSSRRTSGILLLIAASCAMVGVIFGLHDANQSQGALRGWLTAAVIVGVVLSWGAVHTVYTLRYAHLYYTEPRGGISFPGEDVPDYWDFAYVSFTLGMTFQVSDNSVLARSMRRTVLAHCLLSYVFGTVIIATSINVIAGLV